MERTVLAVAFAVVASALAVVAVGTAVAAPEWGASTALETPGNNTSVEIVARYPTDDGHHNQTVLTGVDFASVGEVTVDNRTGTVYVPVTLTDSGARNFTDVLRERGFADEGVSRCPKDWRNDTGRSWCLLTIVDGEVVYSAGVAPGLAHEIDSGDFLDDPRLRMLAENRPEVRELRAALVGEPIPSNTTTTTITTTSTTTTTTATTTTTTTATTTTTTTSTTTTPTTTTPSTTTTSTATTITSTTSPADEGDEGDGASDGPGGGLPAPGFSWGVAVVGLVLALVIVRRRPFG